MRKIKIDGIFGTQKIAVRVAEQLKGGEVIGLIGDLGSGKTTFVQFLASALGIKEKINSPTFVLMKVYNAKNAKIRTMIHADAYRLNNSAELKNIGMEEYLGRNDSVVLIEWADKVKDILPKGAMIISFEDGNGENKRIIKIDYVN